jgi:hypothetical protein
MRCQMLPTTLAIAIAMAAGALAAPAMAETPLESAKRWGLMGTWKVDCAAPTSQSNGALSYAARGGKLIHDRSFGKSGDSHVVSQANILASGELELLITFDNLKQTRRFRLKKEGAGVIRATRNCVEGGSDCSIIDGKLAATGTPIGQQFKCN